MEKVTNIILLMKCIVHLIIDEQLHLKQYCFVTSSKIWVTLPQGCDFWFE